MIRFLQLIVVLLCFLAGSKASAFQIKSTFVDAKTGKPVAGIEVFAEDIDGNALTDRRKTDSAGTWNPIVNKTLEEVVVVYSSPFHKGDRVNATVRSGVADVGKVPVTPVVILTKPVLTPLATGGSVVRLTLSSTSNVSSERVLLRLELPKVGTCAKENLPLTFELLAGSPEPLVRVSGVEVTKRTLRAQAFFDDCAGGSATILVDWLLQITTTEQVVELVFPASLRLNHDGHTLKIGPWRSGSGKATGENELPLVRLSFGISSAGMSLYTAEAEGRASISVK